ncbi:MAG: DNA primase [Bacillota bacterium]
MHKGIPENIIEEIRQRTDLVDLVSEYLKLERRGKNMVGLCPFHSEKTPSFTVSPEKQLFHCFGCGASGNAFSFIMQMDNLNFPEAARILASRCGVKIPEANRSEQKKEDFKEKIYRTNMLATRFYAYCLKNTEPGKQALEYLQKRGIAQQTIEKFRLGYAPSDWQGFLKFAQKKGADPESLVKAGLVSPGQKKGYYDRFRNRIMFPIFDISGKVSGFGGRLLSESEKSGPKYLNSPETLVFDKGSTLYGLNLARETIRREKKAIVMEGYTDVIAAYQAGIKNVVASLGTALTKAQARQLRFQAETVVTAYDSDIAGEAATWRGLAILQSTGCLVQVAALPEGSDPDSYIKEYGADSFLQLVDKATPLMEYRLTQLKKRYDLSTDKDRVEYTDELMSILLSAVNHIEQNYYLKKAAEELAIDEEALRSELKKRQKWSNRYKEEGKKDTPQEKNGQQQKSRISPAEKILISLMLQSKEIAEKGRNVLKLNYLTDSRVKEIVEKIWEYLDNDDTATVDKLLNYFDDPQINNLITEAVTDPSLQDLPPQTAKRMAEDCINQLYKNWAKKQQRELQKKLKELEMQGEEDKIEELLRKHQDLLNIKDDSPYRLGKGGDFNG